MSTTTPRAHKPPFRVINTASGKCILNADEQLVSPEDVVAALNTHASETTPKSDGVLCPPCRYSDCEEAGECMAHIMAGSAQAVREARSDGLDSLNSLLDAATRSGPTAAEAAGMLDKRLPPNYECALLLAAISTAAGQNTRESAKQRIGRDSPYWTPVYEEVCKTVDREMELRERLEKAFGEITRLSDPSATCVIDPRLLSELILWTKQVGEQGPERVARGIAAAARAFNTSLRALTQSDSTGGNRA